MMKRSFAEAEFLRSETDRHNNLEALQRNIENFRDLDCPICDPEMDDYFKACSRITQLRNKMQVHVHVQNECVKLQLIAHAVCTRRYGQRVLHIVQIIQFADLLIKHLSRD